MPLEKLRELFAKPVDELQLNYPKVEYLKNLGFEAFLVTLNVGTETFPTCFNLIKDGKNEVSWNHFEADGKHTLFKISEEFCGRNVHLLTNDIDLIKSISKAGFAPLQLGLFGMSLARSNLIPKATLNIGTTMFGALIGKAEALKRRKNSLLIGEKKRDPIFPMKNGEIGSIRQGSETKRIGRENMTEYIAPLSLWLVHFGGLEAADIKRLKQLEQENARLKKMLAERDLELDVMKEINAKNCDDDLVAVYALRLHLRNPESEMILGPIEMQDARSGTVDQQLAQIWIASLGDPEQVLLASGGEFAGNKA
ncbi:hypothetical protein NLI96_g13135 [Meripilus lineatus]|uniref:Uncharacterized protein n=1 Tax=Meripilus lineatus TaxID=2056292 RepID=A0AAD5UNM3_9APHY|nr:hypothetical protein NLI96_g13135 [Physisporinus lineatus]